MKVTHKLYICMMLGLTTALCIFAYFVYRQEVRELEMDATWRSHILGRALAVSVGDAWQNDGEERALKIINNAHVKESHFRIRWVWPKETVDNVYRPHVPLRKLSPLAEGRDVSVCGKMEDGVAYIHTYIPVKTAGGKLGALEISEASVVLEKYSHLSTRRMIYIVCILVIVGGLIMILAGHWMVGRRMQVLADHARRIGNGDLTSRLEPRGHDEIAQVGQEMNAMSRRLEEAHESLIRENSVRLETLKQLRHTERLATLGQLSSGMAHEFGTPLNVISGRAQLITSGELKKEEIGECSRIIGEQVKRMTEIMQRLLDFARRRTSKRLPADIHDLVRKVFELIRPNAQKQNVILQLIENADVPMLTLDTIQIQQVLTNLLVNAIQAMPGGGRAEVGFRLETARPSSLNITEEKEYLLVYVKDEGEGIAQENIGHVFDPFFTTKDSGKGTGLGLSIAHEIVQDHGGWIDVKSEIGKGSCFSIYLPVEESGCTDES